MEQHSKDCGGILKHLYNIHYPDRSTKRVYQCAKCDKCFSQRIEHGASR